MRDNETLGTGQVKRRRRQATFSLPISNVPSEVKDALIREAERRDSNMNDVAVSALATRFHIPFEESGRRAPVPAEPVDGPQHVPLQVPLRLRRAIKVHAVMNKTTASAVCIETWEEAYT